MIDPQLRDQIGRVATAPIALIACDFDGTLAALAPSPEEARADEGSLAALKRLASMESTHVAVISGRARSTLVSKLEGVPGITLIGGHGAEMPGFTGEGVDAQKVSALGREMAEIAEKFPGVRVESKPTGVAVHYRAAAPENHAQIRELAKAAAQRLSCPLLRDGIMVVEVGVLAADKGGALRWLRDRFYAHNVLFVGDDITDEDAFAALKPSDIGVKVGDGTSAALHRTTDVFGVRAMLEAVADLRRDHLGSRRITPIDDLALLSDQRTCALIDPAGRAVWMCAPRFDAAPIFAHLLCGAAGGFFEVSPADNRPIVKRQYEKDSFILRTEYGGDDSGLVVRDYLDCSAGRPFQRAGRSDLVRVVEGRGRVTIRFSPRFDFGRFPTRLKVGEHGLTVTGSIDPSALQSPGVVWSIQEDGQHQTAVAVVDVEPNRPLVLELRVGSTGLKPSVTSEPARREATRVFWAGWAGTLRPPPLYPDLCRRSALAIKALCYGPTGAICAAATASLPEQMGGVRNWDYRFCWVRDACMSATALTRMGSTGHALKLLDWLGVILEELGSPERLRPIYTVRGSELGPEGEVSEACGYGDSRPVRVGNGAAHQVQLDCFGCVADLIAALAATGAPLTPEHWRMMDAMVGAVRARWKEPDHGIWEVRGPMRHHVHSKAMCWFTVARSIQARELAGEPIDDADRALADEIRADVLEKGFDRKRGWFTAAYGEAAIDAACLLVGLTGLVAPDDPRFAGTVRAVEKELFENNSVLRYRYEDGLPGVEGGFHLCTGWLIESLWLTGRKDDARALLDIYVKQCGPLGLYAEERCTFTGRALGNYPQAYSHLALINACYRLSGS